MAWPKQTRYLGKSTPRVDGLLKATGAAKYTSDIRVSGMLWAGILRSRWGSAEILSIDLTRARAVPGIKAALLVRELPRRARYYGEELAAVAGVSRTVVEEALRLIDVEARPLKFVVSE